MSTEINIKLGRLTALATFFLGLAFSVACFMTYDDGVGLAALIFTLLMTIINIVILISILLKARRDKDNREKLFSVCKLMLLNIPVVILYYCFTIYLFSTAIITFKNSTQSTLTNINIIGCGGGYINELESGESETVWVDIPNDCGIEIVYTQDMQQKKEPVISYLSNGMGQKITHNIGGENEER